MLATMVVKVVPQMLEEDLVVLDSVKDKVVF